MLIMMMGLMMTVNFTTSEELLMFPNQDIVVNRVEQIRLLTSDLNKDGITEEQKIILMKAINLLFHSIYWDISDTHKELQPSTESIN